jgi:uncharacterized glyoxalase superfamily protein PhnB
LIEPVPRQKRKATGRAGRRRAPSSRRSPSAARRRPAEQSSVTKTNGANSGLAPGMQALNTYLAVANVGASIAFLERAFGFTRGVVLADVDGQFRYAEMRHGNGVVMLIRKGDTTAATSGVSAVYTYVDDVDRARELARQAGAGVETAEDKPWGDRVVAVTDPDGYRWMLATFKKLAPFS